MVSATSDIFDPHQQRAFDKLIAEHGGIVWMEVGAGKTRVALMAGADIAQDSGHPVILVVARRAAFYDWQQEIATLQLDVDVMELEEWIVGTLCHRTTFLLVSEGMLNNPVMQSKIQVLNDDEHIGCIIVDELWLFKNPKSQKHQAIRPYTESNPSIGLSGSIMTARDMVDIFGQVAAVGRMKQLAHSLTRFRETYQKGINEYGYVSWFPKPGAYKQIMEKIEPFVSIYMPRPNERKARTNILKVRPSKQQLAYFKELQETAAIEGKFELSNVANIITKAQQISNGWFQAENGHYHHFESPKLDRTIALVEEILEQDEKTKVVIWCAFKHDIQVLRAALFNSRSKKIATLQSGVKFDVGLWRQPHCRICLATEASGTSVNHFAQVPYGIYFSQDFKWTSLQQSQGRHTRRSSLHETAYFTFLHTEKSLDAQIFYTVKNAATSEASFIKQMDVLSWIKGRRVSKEKE
jgi:hypothetical protein